MKISPLEKTGEDNTCTVIPRVTANLTYSQVYLLAVAVQKQVYDKSLPSLLFTECVQSCGRKGKA